MNTKFGVVLGLILFLPFMALAQPTDTPSIVSKEYPAAWLDLAYQQKDEDQNILFADRIPLQFPEPDHLGAVWVNPETQAESDMDLSPAILVTMAPRSTY